MNLQPLYGERYPTYFDTCLFIHRALHDETFTAPDDIREYAAAMEAALYNHLPEPDSDKSTAQCAAECFKGMTIEEYHEYVREFMASPAFGFEGMTYGEGFYKPMTEVVKYLAQNGFTIFISSGSERAMVRELIKGSLDEWIPSDRVIGSTFSLIASGQGSKAGRKYTITADDQILMEGNLVVKNQNTNKVFSIIDEIGKCPILVFGNSSGDLAMAQYVLQHGGKGYMPRNSFHEERLRHHLRRQRREGGPVIGNGAGTGRPGSGRRAGTGSRRIMKRGLTPLRLCFNLNNFVMGSDPITIMCHRI